MSVAVAKFQGIVSDEAFAKHLLIGCACFVRSVKYSEQSVPMSSARERPVAASVAEFTSLILPSAPMVTKGSRLASIRLRLWTLANFAAFLITSASAARRFAVTEGARQSMR